MFGDNFNFHTFPQSYFFDTQLSLRAIVVDVILRVLAIRIVLPKHARALIAGLFVNSNITAIYCIVLGTMDKS